MALRNLPLFLIVLVMLTGCFRYSFTGTSIPENVNTVFIPFFPDQSSSGLSELSDLLNQALIDRFINQSRLQLASDESSADAILTGVITGYINRPFSVGGDQQANQNEVLVTVNATFRYRTSDEPVYNKPFTGTFRFDPLTDPANGERDAANEALLQISDNVFNEAVSSW